MLTRTQKLQALKDFLEGSALAQVDGHSHHDGPGCKGHDDSFTAKAEELLALIEDENYGYEPLLLEVRSIRGGGKYDRRDLKSFLERLNPHQFEAYQNLEDGQWLSLLEFDDGSTSIELNSSEDFEIRQIELAREATKNKANLPEPEPKLYLDPLPWRNRRSFEDRSFKRDRYDREWEFSPRAGYSRAVMDYAPRGGIDPEPYLDLPPEPGLICKGRTRWATMAENKPRNAERVFRPREGFDQDEANYS